MFENAEKLYVSRKKILKYPNSLGIVLRGFQKCGFLTLRPPVGDAPAGESGVLGSERDESVILSVPSHCMERGWGGRRAARPRDCHVRCHQTGWRRIRSSAHMPAHPSVLCPLSMFIYPSFAVRSRARSDSVLGHLPPVEVCSFAAPRSTLVGSKSEW